MIDRHISSIRAFNRFYTNIIGLLDQHVLNSEYSLPEVRILYELYHHENLTASDIISTLGIDKGYLSRIFRHLEKKKMIFKKKYEQDGRSIHLNLTTKGRREFETLNKASHLQIKKLLEPLSTAHRQKLVRNMEEIKQILSSIQ